MNVGELIEHLQRFDPATPVKVRARPGTSFLPEDVYPPFMRAFSQRGDRDHVLIEAD